MSSPPSDSPETPKRRRRPFEPWRKVMLTGALWLLMVSILNAALENGLPGWLAYAFNFVGYGLLAVGFVLAMRSFREK